jgi:two-component system, OmpR family, sensor histidine kinase AdeS
MRLATKLSLAMAGVAAFTAAASLPAALVYTENRIAGLPPPIARQVERQIELNAWDDFDGMAELGVVVAVSALAATSVGIFLARRMTRPVDDVVTAAHQVAVGDPSARARRRDRRDELGRLVDDFNAMAEALQRLERDRVLATAAIAHELRSPLTIMSSRLQAATDGIITVDADEIARLLHQTEHLTGLVEDLRTLSLSTAGRLQVNLLSIDVASLVRELIDERATGLHRHELRSAGDPTVSADATLLRRAIINLLDNSERHTDPGSPILITIAEETDQLCIDVANDGEPIDPQQLSRLFDPYYQAPTASDRRSPGSGLGLTIVAAVVQAHNGTIKAGNTPTGARFTLSLPRARSGGEESMTA